MKFIQELDVVALTCDIPSHGLLRGDVGAAVMAHGDGESFEVEFVGYNGHTLALLTLEKSQIRLLDSHDIPHARELASA